MGVAGTLEMESVLIQWIITIQVGVENSDWESLSGGTNCQVEEPDRFDKDKYIFVQDPDPIRVGAQRIDTLMKLSQLCRFFRALLCSRGIYVVARIITDIGVRIDGREWIFAEETAERGIVCPHGIEQ